MVWQIYLVAITLNSIVQTSELICIGKLDLMHVPTLNSPHFEQLDSNFFFKLVGANSNSLLWIKVNGLN